MCLTCFMKVATFGGRYCPQCSPLPPLHGLNLSSLLAVRPQCTHINMLWSFVVVLSSPAAHLVDVTPSLLESTWKVVAIVTVSIRISALERYFIV